MKPRCRIVLSERVSYMSCIILTYLDRSCDTLPTDHDSPGSVYVRDVHSVHSLTHAPSGSKGYLHSFTMIILHVLHISVHFTHTCSLSLRTLHFLCDPVTTTSRRHLVTWYFRVYLSSYLLLVCVCRLLVHSIPH